jgi:hypothetical protein
MPYFIGDNVRVGVAINAATAGVTYDGTPGTYDVMKLAPGGIKIEPRNAKTRVEEIDVDARDVITGGLYYTITMELVGSYSYREHIYKLLMGGAIGTSGSGPYTHAQALADKLLFGAVKLEYTDQAEEANQVITETYANFCVTALSLKESPEGYMTMTVSGIASALTRATNVASLSTVQNTEPISWAHLSLSLNGATTYHIGDLSIDLGAKLSEGEFDHASTTPALLPGIFRAGPRELGWSIGLRMDSTARALCEDTTASWTGANSFTWNNSAATTSNRQLVITFGTSYIDSVSHGPYAWGRQTSTLNMKALDGTTRFIAITTINALTTIAT